jgi:hypothetical protein
MPTEQPPPIVLAMILAETVLHDLTTDKMTIQGTYHAVEAPTFPHTHPAINLCVALTEGYGETALQFRLVDVDDTQPAIFELESTVDFADPFEVVEMVFSKLHVVFPQPGEYRLQLFAGSHPLLERRLEVAELQDLD